MHEMLDFCRFGQGGASQHRHLDARAARGSARRSSPPRCHHRAAAAAEGEELTKQCFGEEVAWVPWRRPGFELGLRIARLHESRSDLEA